MKYLDKTGLNILWNKIVSLVGSSDLAKKENLGQLYLSSKYKEPLHTGASAYDYTTPSLTSSAPQGFTITTTGTPSLDNFTDIYTMVGGNGAGKIGCKYKEGDGFIIQFPMYFKMTSFKITSSNLGFQIYGSNDGVNYTMFHNVGSSGMQGSGTFTVNNNYFYKYYKFIGANYNTGTGYIYNNMVFYGKAMDSNTEANNLLLLKEYTNESLNNYEEGLIVRIKTPSSYVESSGIAATLDIYGLGPKTIPADLKASTRYTLIYNGTNFIHDDSL